MMPQLFIVCLILGISSTVNGKLQKFIQATTPTSSSTHCLDENPCNTLNELIITASTGGEQQREVFFSFQNVVFLSGNHIINVSNYCLTIADAEYLTLVGEGEVTITCLNEFYFLFTDVYQILIKSLKFVNCKAFAQSLTKIVRVPEQFNNTFIFWGTSSHVEFNRVEIISENATGIVLLDGGNFKFLKSNFSTGGIGIFSWQNTVHILGCLFKGSSFKVYGSPGDSIIIEFTVFQQTTAWPVISCSYSKSLELGNIKMVSNPAQFLMSIIDCKVLLNGKNLFYNNSGALTVGVEGTLDIDNATVHFVNNSVRSAFGLPGTPLCAVEGKVIFTNSFIVFQNNSGEDCGGIVAHRSTIKCTYAMINFIANKGKDGGAIAMYKESRLLFPVGNEGTIITFVDNMADRRGGGVFVDDMGYTTDFHRNLSHSFFGPSPDANATFHFVNNTARFSGNQIHGGWIDWWININRRPLSFNKNATNMFHFEPDGPLAVSSGPMRVCMCTNSLTNCSINEYQTEVFPGQTINLEVVAVGQRYGTTISFIVASTDKKGESVANPEFKVIPEAEYFQNVQRTCTPVHYTIMSPKNEERLYLRPFQRNKLNIEQNLLKQHPFHENLFKEFSIKATLKKCPLGFAFSHITYSCVCLKSLELRGLSCNTKSLHVVRTEQKWVTAAFNHTMPDEYPGVIIHDQCPYDYCRKDADSLSIRLEFYEEQCANNRSGTLCGKCQPNLSQILGSSRCRRCSHLMLLAIVPITVALGALLVAFLMILNLTVSVGTINGLTFYANVIRSQHTMFFVPEISNSFLNKFIAWLNLDLGIESCFYDGLDAFTKAWLQFLFPIYIWLLVIVIIISSHYSTRVSRISGNNAVQVLATLFLLSYTKLLRVIITVFSSTVIVYPDKFSKWVWLYDGNVEFLRGKHLILFIPTFIFLLLSVPYTLSLVTIQWLLRVSHYCILFWVQKFKPLFDAYTGPYKTRHRYWTGLLLVVRLVVLIAFSLNRANNPAINLFIISIISFTLILFLYATRWVYKSIINNCLEITFVLNLGILSTSILFDMANNKHSLIMVQLSTGLAFTLFVLITLYHAQEQFLHSTIIGRKFKRYVITKYLIRRQAEEGATDHEDAAVHHNEGGGVSQTVIELKECLLTDES